MSSRCIIRQLFANMLAITTLYGDNMAVVFRGCSAALKWPKEFTNTAFGNLKKSQNQSLKIQTSSPVQLSVMDLWHSGFDWWMRERKIEMTSLRVKSSTNCSNIETIWTALLCCVHRKIRVIPWLLSWDWFGPVCVLKLLYGIISNLYKKKIIPSQQTTHTLLFLCLLHSG